MALQAAIDRHYGATHALELKKVMEEMSVADTADTSLEVVEESEQETIDLEKLVDEGEEAPVIRLVNIILTDAIKRGASDIHIEPYEREYRVRYRIDGILYEVMNPPPKLKEAIASRIKILAKLDIAEKRLPAGRPHQDQDEARGQGEGARLPRLGRFRRSSARRSSAASSTRTTSCST